MRRIVRRFRDASTNDLLAADKRDARRQMAFALLLLTAFVFGCRFNTFRSESSGMPPQAQAVIDGFSKDVQQERYDKIYADAAEEWRRATNAQQSKEFFTTIREKLGTVRTRTVQTIREQENSGGKLPGRSLVVIYQTAFERAEGMETFTLVERDERWLLAGYFVNSSALKQ
ncbi:MAG: DUF4019 domain-containing protein [Pyrinomonadaceae bacterium]|nr:DUF4019 domain-containing protein [Pyrinomonadaceae bacterium]